MVKFSLDIESIADVFFVRTQRNCLFNITAIENIPSIMQRGILCHHSAMKLPHNSIAMSEVQDRRARVRIPNGLWLHQYANLYFSCRNPMMYKRKEIAETICVLLVSASVLDIPDCVISDMNAAADLARFYPAAEGVGTLDFEKVFSRYWTHDSDIETRSHRAIKCAEILIPHSIPYSYVESAYVVSKDAQKKLEDAGFDKGITVYPEAFFR